jgi:hypothetical protein
VKNSNNAWVIPAAEIRPLIMEWGMRNNYKTKASWLHLPCGEPDEVTLQAALSFRSGVPMRRISGILNDSNGYANLSFDTADRLLCAMDMVDEWQGRLASYYAEPIEVSRRESQRLMAVAA